MMSAMSETGQSAGGPGQRRPSPKLDMPGLREALRAGARTDARGRWPRRLVLLAAVLVALAVAWALAGRSLPRSPESAARAAKEELARLEARSWSRAQVFSPGPEERDPATGEVTSPFHGFAISVDSSPSGARVLVDGGEMGETPLAASLDCEPGSDVEVRVEKTGYRPLRRAVRCRADTLVRLELRLERGAAAPR